MPDGKNFADDIAKLKTLADGALAQAKEQGLSLDSLTAEDRVVYEKCQRAIDPNSPGPVLIVEPQRSKVVGKRVTGKDEAGNDVEELVYENYGCGKTYVLTLPKWGTRLSTQAVIFSSASTALGSRIPDYMLTVGELLSACYGWFPSRDKKSIETVQANILDQTKWPKPRPVDWLTTRDPYIEDEITLLLGEYNKWADSVTPTKEELSKYYAMLV